MDANFCVFLDAGHGGVNPQGQYVTPGKRYQHDQGTFHDNGWFYEGVFNRQIVYRVAQKLDRLRIQYKILSHSYLDNSLQNRVETANWYHRNFQRGFVVSPHANAATTNARGFEVYTSPGSTRSDTLATYLWEEVSTLLGSRIRMRPDLSDGDHDKEARFYILTQTAMPAILIEHLFFDNLEDATLLMDEEMQELFAEAEVRSIIRFANQFYQE